MKCEVEFSDLFYLWWKTLSEKQQNDIAAAVGLLEEQGVTLGYPRSSKLRSSRQSRMRELRVQIDGDPYRVLYAFDSRRVAVLLVGGCKRGVSRWFEQMIPLADKLFDAHLHELEQSRGDE